MIFSGLINFYFFYQPRFQRRKTTLMMFNRQFECKGITKHLLQNRQSKIAKLSNYLDPDKKKDTCLILHDVVTLLTTLLVSEIKMAAQMPRLKVSDVLKGFL